MSTESAHSEPCQADDCPCWLAGRDSVRLELAERHMAVTEAATALIETLTPTEEPTAAHNERRETDG